MKLSKTNVNRIALSSGKRDEIFVDDDLPGFGVRVRAGGSRKYVVHYRQGGIQRRYTLGSTSVLTLDEARTKARKLLVAVDDGKDPNAEKVTKRAAAALTFSAVMKDYLEARQAAMNPRSHEECSRHLKKHWKPLHKLSLASVSRPVVAAHLRKIASASGPVAADRARSTLSAMFGWAIGEGLCDANPVLGTNKASEDKPRERVLADDELAAIWNALPDGDYGRIVRLLMLTAQRRDEIGSLSWPEVDVKGKLIVLPSTRTKNSRAHEVPLSDSALAIVEDCQQRRGRALLFGEGEGGYSGWSRSKDTLDEKLQLAPWT